MLPSLSKARTGSDVGQLAVPFPHKPYNPPGLPLGRGLSGNCEARQRLCSSGPGVCVGGSTPEESRDSRVTATGTEIGRPDSRSSISNGPDERAVRPSRLDLYGEPQLRTTVHDLHRARPCRR
jgi:hypothetical protein